MDNVSLYTKINSLPRHLKQEVQDFVDFLRQKGAKKQPHQDARAYGILKGKIKMTPDFDEPLDDFKAYM